MKSPCVPLAHPCGLARGAVFGALVLVGLPVALNAAPPPGRLLAAQCAQCHGTNGQSVSGFESISGEKTDEMYRELLEMKYRPVESIMDRQARGYTDEQLRLIAEYLATLPRGRGEGGGDGSGGGEGERAVTETTTSPATEPGPSAASGEHREKKEKKETKRSPKEDSEKQEHDDHDDE